jgi:hypothetical protein
VAGEGNGADAEPGALFSLGAGIEPAADVYLSKGAVATDSADSREAGSLADSFPPHATKATQSSGTPPLTLRFQLKAHHLLSRQCGSRQE